MITENELLKELAADIIIPEIEPDEVTARMLCEAAQIGYSKAKRKLDDELEAGHVTCRMVRYNGKIATAYRKTTG